jgi:uncharacterized membrane protein YccC
LLGLAVPAITFAAVMALAWGPRAGSVSFAAVLAIVFTMGLPAGQAPLPLVGWHVLGVLAYLPWSLAVTALLQPRFRSLALATVLGATAGMLRSRAELLAAGGDAEATDRHLQAWIRSEAALAAKLQAARDLLFAAGNNARARRETAVLLRLIEVRDMLLASRVDLDLLGDDETGTRLRLQVALRLRGIACGLDEAQGLLGGASAALARTAQPASPLVELAGTGLAAGDARARLLPALADRVRQLQDDVDRIRVLLRGDEESLPLSGDELQLFVSPDNWTLAALRAQLTLASPVMRHALRAALALGTACVLGLLLPWASHPQWLILSVAVVLRGNLEQTLVRRDVRVAGTVLGCLVVLLLAQLPSPLLLSLAFICAVGLAHGFALERYFVTATAATVMALLQAHLVAPDAGFAVGERLADTFIGALLAWGFSYVLPAWERQALPNALAAAVKALQAYVPMALRVADDGAVAQRLARRTAYDALGEVAAAVQRSAVEPAGVRPPVAELSRFLDHAQRLLAHLAMVRLTLTRRGGDLDMSVVRAALQATEASILAALAVNTPPHVEEAVQAAITIDMLPAVPPDRDLMPWLLRRLKVSQQEAEAMGSAACVALAALARN